MLLDSEVIVIGAGPSGMACASRASESGLKVLVLDEQPTPGGQLYRNFEGQSVTSLRILGKDYAKGKDVIERFRRSGAEYLPQSVVWNIGKTGRVCFSHDGKSHEVLGKRIVIATGAMERPAPFPGWTLPGVAGAGGIDALFKSSFVLPKGPAVLVGSGPLMLLVAHHLHCAEVEVSHMLDTTPPGCLEQAFLHLPQAMKRFDYLLKGAGMLAKSIRTVGKTFRGVRSYRATGDFKVRSLAFHQDGKESVIPTEMVLSHEGIIPRTEFSRQLRLTHDWYPKQRYWHPRVDDYGRTTNPMVFMVGDGAFVHGGPAAALKGELAAIRIAGDLGFFTPREVSTAARPLKAALKREISPRPFVDALFQPRTDLYSVPDDTVVCRCEEVTAGAIRSMLSRGLKSVAQVKATTRCGMGPCQGRMCTIALAEIVAAETGYPMDKLVMPTVRPPVRNLPLGELAKMSLLPELGGKENVR
jgi:thioredoxin reductase/bacterioferritin-associated ferredoxin